MVQQFDTKAPACGRQGGEGEDRRNVPA